MKPHPFPTKVKTSRAVERLLERHLRDHEDLLALCEDDACIVLAELANRIRQP